MAGGSGGGGGLLQSSYNSSICGGRAGVKLSVSTYKSSSCSTPGSGNSSYNSSS